MTDPSWTGGELPAPGGSPYHLRAGAVSVVVDPGPAGEGSPLPSLVHWGAALTGPLDGQALRAILEPAVPHAGPDVAWRRPIVPLPSDGWRLRPALAGSRPDGTAFSPAFRWSGVEQQPGPDGSLRRLVLHASDADAGLNLTVALGLDAAGVLRSDLAVRNDGSEVYLLDQLAHTLPLPARATEVLDLTGRWCRERDPQRTRPGFGTWARETRRGRTGHDAPLVFAVGEPHFSFRTGEVWAVHLAWSGDSSLWAERSPNGYAQVGAAELLAPGEVRLAPGESYAAPSLLAAYSDRGLDGVSDAFHAFVRSRPGHVRSPRKVLLNTWEAVYMDHRLDALLALADAAAEVGVERFVLDDGWFGARRDDTAGLGDWQVSPDAWPQGLSPLIEHVRERGMDFGLWVEPEMVNPDSDLFRAHPDWILHVDGRTPVTWRHQYVLDLGRPEVVAYLVGQLDALLETYDIAFLKWDHNRDLVDPGHHGTPGVHAQTLALYGLLDELRRRHPGVEIESCASGGGRVDLGILERTDRIWASDTIDAHERQHIQRWTGLLVPPELVGSHIGAGMSHTTGRRHSLAFRAATALFGHLGIEADLTAMTAAEREGIASVVATYKAHRDLLHHGVTVRLDDVDPGALAHGVVSGDASEALFAYVRLDSSPTELPRPWRLAGLDPGATYRVRHLVVAGGPTRQELRPPGWTEDPAGVVATGECLQRLGLGLPILHPEQAFLVHVQRV